MNKPLYEQDFYQWSAEQGRALRDAGTARINTPTPIDWENVAEEIETLGRSERATLRSRLSVVLEHFLKLQASPAELPRNSWMDTIDAQRVEIERLLEESASLRREVAGIIEAETARARRTVKRALARYAEEPSIDLSQLTFTEDQVLGDWFPNRA